MLACMLHAVSVRAPLPHCRHCCHHRCRQPGLLAATCVAQPRLVSSVIGTAACLRQSALFALQDVERVGEAGKVVRVNYGFARNFLVPNRLAVAVNSLPRHARPDVGSSSAAAVQRHEVAASSSEQQSLERQQQQFDKLVKTLTGSPLVGG